MSRKTKVLHIIGGMDRGGAETFLMNVVRNIDRERFEIVILTFLGYRVLDNRYTHQDELEKLGVKIVKIEDTRFNNPFKFIRDVEGVIRQNSIDVVHSNIDFMSVLPLVAAKRAGVRKRIAHSHTTFNQKLTNPLNKLVGVVCRWWVRRLATDRVACGEEAGRWLFGNKSFTVISNAIDLDRFAFNKKERVAIRKEYGIVNSALVVLSVGRLEPAKNHRFLIEAFGHLAGSCSLSRLIILGSGSEKESLERLARELGLEDRVIIAASDDVPAYYSAADVFVMSSIFEGLPFAAVEAQASGLPLLLSDNISDEVAITKNVAFLPLKDGLERWAEALEEISKSATMEARTILKEDFREYSIGSTIGKLERVYE